MTATVTIQLVELETSYPTSYDGHQVDLSAGGGYVEVNLTYTEVDISETTDISSDDPTSAFKKRMVQYVMGIPNPTGYLTGKDQ